MPYLVASATYDSDAARTAIFALNRHLAQEQELHVEFRGLDPRLSVVTAQELHHARMEACNTEAAPDTVALRAHEQVRVVAGELKARLKPGSWNVFVLQHPKT
jgi:alpha-L-arabinofuranosidase